MSKTFFSFCHLSTRNFPAAHTYNSDVGTVHRLVEDEFFDLEHFHSRGHFLAKATTYQA